MSVESKLLDRLTIQPGSGASSRQVSGRLQQALDDRFAVLTLLRGRVTKWVETTTRVVRAKNPATGPRALRTGRPSHWGTDSVPMPTSDPHHGQEGTASPESAASGKPRGTLDAMRRQLEQHSALEDLGPLFGPKAQGQGLCRDSPGGVPC